MSGVGVFEVILLVAVAGVGIGGFVWVALKDD
jgi:hypothetical protein